MREEKQQGRHDALPTAGNNANLPPDPSQLGDLDAERLRRAFSLIEAPEGSYEKVMDMTRQDPSAQASSKCLRTHRMTRRAFLTCAALSVAAVGTVAYAAANTDFFQTAFGDKGQADTQAYEIESELGFTQIMPARQWVKVDDETAQRLVGDYVETVNESVSYEGYTLTIGSCVVDENGLAVATFALENPEGIPLDTDGLAYEYGYMALARGADISTIETTDVAGEKRAGTVALMDHGASTETRIIGSLYFDIGARNNMSIEDGMSWYLLPQPGTLDPNLYDRISHVPTKILPTQGLSTEDGSVTASISPLGLVINTPDDRGQEAIMANATTGEQLRVVVSEWVTQIICITFEDGSEYVVRDGETMNTTGGGIAEDFSSQSIMFNRLIDPATIANVTINAPDLSDPDVVLLP